MIMRIRDIRCDKNISQVKLASDMGVTPSVVSNWEHETALPRTRQLPELARVLGVDIGELFEPDGNPYAVPDVFPDHEEYGAIF